MLALARKINHWALGHYRAAMEDHNHLRNDPYLKRRRQYLLFVATNRVSKAHLSITFSGTPETSDPRKSPPFLLIYTGFWDDSLINQNLQQSPSFIPLTSWEMFNSQWQKKGASWKGLDKIFFTRTGDAARLASERSPYMGVLSN